MKPFLISMLCLCMTSSILGQSKVQQLTQQNYSPSAEVIRPFALVKNQAKSEKVDLSIIDQYELLDLDSELINQLLNQKAKSLQLTIPIGGGKQYELELIPSEFNTKDIKTYASSNRNKYLKIDRGQHYWGTIKGDDRSMVALSFYDDEITGSINTATASYSLSKLKGHKEHILYQEKNLKEKPTFSCYSDDIEKLKPKTTGSQAKVLNPNNAVRMYIEVDNDIYQEFGTVQATSNYITAALNQVAVIYANESINFLVNELVIWDTTDPYTGPSSGNYLNQFQANLNGSFNGDLAHLIGNSGNGGVAYVNGICANKNYAIGYSGISNSFQNVPAYSWTINVLTHEIGHNLGSPHTHACSWNGNNTAIDGCGPASGNSEGCTGPVPSAGGTIMSYCHLTSVGINFNLGFGPQPGDLIRGIVYNAPCLTPSSNTCGDGIQNGNETGIDCGGSCPSCPPSCTDGIKNGNETGVDCGGDCGPCPDVCSGKTEITITLHFDNYPEETSWQLRNSNNAIVASGGTYGSQSDGSTLSISECLSDGCYSFVINDAYGDGLCCSYGQGNYAISNGSETLASGGAFTNSETKTFCIGGEVTSCTDGIQNGNETGIDCGGSGCAPCETCTDGIQNGNETGIDCGGSDCTPCETCTDGIQNGNETGIDCGGSDCAPCETTSCSDVQIIIRLDNYPEETAWTLKSDDGTTLGTGGTYGNLPDGSTITISDCLDNGCYTFRITDTYGDGICCNYGQGQFQIIIDDVIFQSGGSFGSTDTRTFCIGDQPESCSDGIQNGDETGIDCGGDCMPCSTGTCTFTTMIDDDLETISGDWVDGGSDCRRSIYDSAYAASGDYCYRLRDDSYSSTLTTARLDLASAEEVVIEFSYIARSMDNAYEGFVLEISNDNGSTYVTIAEWYRDVDFANRQRMFESVAYTGSLSAQTKIRFRCDASSNADYVYLDDITILACINDSPSLPSTVDDDKTTISDDTSSELSLYPNPADIQVDIEFEFNEAQAAQLSLYDLSGRIVYSQEAELYKSGRHHISVNTAQLNEGMYYAVLSTTDARLVKKFVIVRQ